MRALGPGSVSSILKTILDVVYYVLWVAAGAATLGGIGVLLLSFEPEIFSGSAVFDRLHIEGHWLGPAVLILLVIADAWFGGALVIVGRLRRIFGSLTAGDPFHPENVRRLRVIAITMALLEIGRMATAAVVPLIFRHHAEMRFSGGLNLSAWFSILVIVVLAEVFREGARLRREAELTI